MKIISFCLLLIISNVSSAKTLLNANHVTLKQKIGQMLLVGFKGFEINENDDITKDILGERIGGVLLFDYDKPTNTHERNIKNPSQLSNLTQSLQKYTRQAANRYKNSLYPLFIAIDYEGGKKVSRITPQYGFPDTLNAKQLSLFGIDTAKNQASQMATTLNALHINMNMAPVVDIDVNPVNPIIGALDRSFSKNPSIVTKYATIFSKAFKDNNIICAYKHFPGHGSATSDTHKGFADVTNTWQKYELDPYKALLNKPYACDMVMVAHVVNKKLDQTGYPASLSKPIMTDLLIKKLKFKGIIITDDIEMKAISNHYSLESTLKLAILGGANIITIGNQEHPYSRKRIAQIINIIYKDATVGANHNLFKKQIEISYQKITKIKQRYQIQ